MGATRKVNWWEVDLTIKRLETDMDHEVVVQREAIPLIFVPGIMGSRLRRGGTVPTADGQHSGDGPDGLPVMRWEPGKPGWMASHFLYAYAKYRKKMIIGDGFNAAYLEVANAGPVGNGFAGLMEDYVPFLESLRDDGWGPLGKLFEFPVYGFGYNWTDSAEAAGAKLATRIEQIIQEAKGVVGACDKVILISHSMGGLVSRACSVLSGARGSILGVVHGVQPVTGSGAAYWRIKAGFEAELNIKDGLKKNLEKKAGSGVLGNDGKDVTVILGNSPGGLQLLPNKLHRTNAGAVAWLKVTKDGAVVDGLALPKGVPPNPPDPYAEIYSVPAVVEPSDDAEPSNNAFWGLVDPNLLAPGASPAPPTPGSIDADTAVGQPTPWAEYIGHLATAKSFHERLGASAHKPSFNFAGTGHATVDVVEMKVEWAATGVINYRTRGFAGQYTTADGWDMKAILQDPKGAGDGTVPLASAQKLNAEGKPSPGDNAFAAGHQPAYETAAAQAFTRQAITALCLMHYQKNRPKKP